MLCDFGEKFATFYHFSPRFRSMMSSTFNHADLLKTMVDFTVHFSANLFSSKNKRKKMSLLETTVT